MNNNSCVLDVVSTLGEYVPKLDRFRNMYEARKEANARVTEGGHLATLGELLHGRAVTPVESDVWRNWVTPDLGLYSGQTKQGLPVVVVAHGCGPLTVPDSINQAYISGLIYGAAKLTSQELQGLVDGKDHDGTDVSSYSLSEFLKASSTPRKKVIIVDGAIALTAKSGEQDINQLCTDNKLFIACAGSPAQAIEYGTALKAKKNIVKYGFWHDFGNDTFEVSRGRVPYLGDSTDNGLNGNNHLDDLGRFVVVQSAPEAHQQESARSATHERITLPLDEIVAQLRHLVAPANEGAVREILNKYK